MTVGQPVRPGDHDAVGLMHPLTALLFPLALLLPQPVGPLADDGARQLTAEQALEPQAAQSRIAWFERAHPFEVPLANQVRIEQRVILRISPRPGNARQNLAANLSAPRSSRLAERSFGDCVPVNNIAGVQAQRGNRLLLFLRDRRLVVADLEKACSAQNFYAGFYLESNEDGRLCIDRDRLQSRNGAKCSVSSMRQIVAIAGD